MTEEKIGRTITFQPDEDVAEMILIALRTKLFEDRTELINIVLRQHIKDIVHELENAKDRQQALAEMNEFYRRSPKRPSSR